MGEKEEVKLLGVWYSPYAIRPKIALRLKSVDYDYVEENLFGSKSELLLKSNPVHKKVPVLLHNNKPIVESLNIVAYIDETWNSSAPSILPSHPYDRALARFWSDFVDNKVWFIFFSLIQQFQFLILSWSFLFGGIFFQLLIIIVTFQ